ncbi:hypothetical protein NC652_037097 [Populus alba x Populus x berolinensis]|nr:hypothetical protein NC652_037097 [Populus alba x Populus x berolinensis]
MADERQDKYFGRRRKSTYRQTDPNTIKGDSEKNQKQTLLLLLLRGYLFVCQITGEWEISGCVGPPSTYFQIADFPFHHSSSGEEER